MYTGIIPKGRNCFLIFLAEKYTGCWTKPEQIASGKLIKYMVDDNEVMGTQQQRWLWRRAVNNDRSSCCQTVLILAEYANLNFAHSIEPQIQGLLNGYFIMSITILWKCNQYCLKIKINSICQEHWTKSYCALNFDYILDKLNGVLLCLN